MNKLVKENELTDVAAVVKQWLQNFVIELNLCPFAKRELSLDRIRFSVCLTQAQAELLTVLQQELLRLKADDGIATTLLIHPKALSDFADYNQFLNLADALLDDLGLLGEFQIASFHPDYQFAGTNNDDAENYTNRSPYPMLHLLREDDVEEALASHPDTAQIPTNNIALMNQLGVDKLKSMITPSQNLHDETI